MSRIYYNRQDYKNSVKYLNYCMKINPDIEEIRKYYYPTIIKYYIRINKINYWLNDISDIIVHFILNSLKLKYYK